MATITIIKCDRCEAKDNQEGVNVGTFQFGIKTYDLCEACYNTIRGVIVNDIHEGLLLGAKAVDDLYERLGEDRAAALFGCSSSYISDTLREVEKNIDEDGRP